MKYFTLKLRKPATLDSLSQNVQFAKANPFILDFSYFSSFPGLPHPQN